MVKFIFAEDFEGCTVPHQQPPSFERFGNGSRGVEYAEFGTKGFGGRASLGLRTAYTDQGRATEAHVASFAPLKKVGVSFHLRPSGTVAAHGNPTSSSYFARTLGFLWDGQIPVSDGVVTACHPCPLFFAFDTARRPIFGRHVTNAAGATPLSAVVLYQGGLAFTEGGLMHIEMQIDVTDPAQTRSKAWINGVLVVDDVSDNNLAGLPVGLDRSAVSGLTIAAQTGNFTHLGDLIIYDGGDVGDRIGSIVVDRNLAQPEIDPDLGLLIDDQFVSFEFDDRAVDARPAIGSLIGLTFDIKDHVDTERLKARVFDSGSLKEASVEIAPRPFATTVFLPTESHEDADINAMTLEIAQDVS